MKFSYLLDRPHSFFWCIRFSFSLFDLCILYRLPVTTPNLLCQAHRSPVLVMLPYLFSILILLFPVRSQFLSCPLEGPQFPPPQNLPSDSTVQSALASLQSKLQSLSSSANGTLDPLTSFSIEAFSTQSTSPLFQFHHAGSSVKASSTGIKNITRDSIYRIGSVSKLVTVYLFLIEAGDSYFSQPITKFVPELAAAAAAQNSSSGGVQQGNSNVLDATQWEQITLGALASHMAGIQRDGR